MSRQRAKLSILSEMLSFPTIRGKEWTGSLSSSKAEPGDLVSLECAPPTKWYLSWLIESRPLPNGNTEYLLESIEDGGLCWWHNVGLNIYNRQRVSENPTWRWSDKQFEFWDRWWRVGRRNNAYIVIPVLPDFDGKAVTLDVRVRFGLSSFRYPKTFDNWKKLLSRDMSAYYMEAVAAYESSMGSEKA